jgi:uncharacterized protein
MKIERTDSNTSVIGDALARADAWINDILSLGGVKDPSVYTRFSMRGKGLDDHTLEAMYVEDHYAARLVELVVKHGVRKGWDLKLPGNPQEAAKARAAYRVTEEELRVGVELAIGALWGRLFGGGVTWIGIDDGLGDAQWVERQKDPVDLAKITRVRFVHSFDRREANIVEAYGDPAHPLYRKPKIYQITPHSLVGAGATGESATAIPGGVHVHESRILHWPGVPSTTLRLAERSGWDDSVLERAWDALRQSGEDHGAKSQILARISQFVFKIKNLGALITGDERKFNRRMGLLDAARARGRALVIDAEEDVENIAQPISGIDTILDKSVERVAAAGGMPASVLVGAPTPEDLDVWDAEVEEWQTSVMRPRHEKLAGYILVSKSGPLAGKEPETWSMAYRPLRTPKPKERAEIRKLQAETDALEVDKGIMPPEAVALHRHIADSTGEGEVQLDPSEVDAALKRRSELAKQPPKDNAALGTVGARSSAAMDVAIKVAQGLIPRDTGKQIYVQFFQLAETEAEKMLPPAGFVPAQPMGAKPGPAPAPANGEGAGAPQGLPGFNDGGNPSTKALPPEGSR